MAKAIQPPMTLDELKMAVARKKIILPPAIQAVAREALSHPDLIALDNASVIARRCGVGTSTVRRLPSYFGFRDFRKMKQFFRKILVDQAAFRAERELK